MRYNFSFLKIFLIIFLLLFFPFFSKAQENRILLYSIKTYWDYPQERALEEFLKELRDTLQKNNYLLEIRNLEEKTALSLLNTGEYLGIAEIKLIGLKSKVSLEWKIYSLGQVGPHYFYTVENWERIKGLTEESVKFVKSVLEAKTLVEKVVITGNLKISEDAILAKIKTRAKEILDPRVLNEDLKNLYKMGYFENVWIKIDQGERGPVVIFEVKERPSIKEIIFKGIKEAKKEDLLKISELKEGQIVTPKDLDKALENLKAYYEQLGYHGTLLNVETEKISPTQVSVIFYIKEGHKKYIKKIEFIGNKALSEKELRKYLSLSEKSVFSPVKKITQYVRTFLQPEPLAEPGVYNIAFLYRDLGKMETAYKNKGYLDIKIGEPIIREEQEGVIIVIPIDEGPQYRIGSLEIHQDLIPKEILFKKIKSKPGEVFSLQTLKEDENLLIHMFSDYGYAYTKVDTEVKREPEKRLINLTFKIDKGPVVFINRIEIEGNTKTRDKVIRRELLLAEGWPFSATRLEKSEERLRRLGFFEEVKIEKEKAVKEEELNLKVKVKEMLTGTFSVGGGYSSAEGLIFMTEVTERNFLGKGQRVSIAAKIGTKTTKYSINFFEPYFMDSRYSLGFSLLNYEIEYEDFTKDTKGGSLKVGYFFTSNLSGYVGYRYEDTQLEDLREKVSKVILESKDIHITSAVNIGLNYDSRNRYFLPTKGWIHRLELEHAGGFLGGDSNFIKFTGEHQVYFPIFLNITGHINFGYGYITEGSGRRVPVFERFFLGGIDSIRGYKYGDVSPRDPETEERIGGTRMFYLQLENIFPLIRSINLNGVVFLDMGSVWDMKTGFKSSEIRKSIGLGIRWISPLGPLRIEWGYNLDKKPKEDSSNFNFQVGGSF